MAQKFAQGTLIEQIQEIPILITWNILSYVIVKTDDNFTDDGSLNNLTKQDIINNSN